MKELIFLALLFAAGPSFATPPTDAQSDAFLRAYSFDALKVLATEGLTVRVASKALTPAQADCIRGRLDFEAILPMSRPMVAAMFQNAALVDQATAFFSSPTGLKLKAFNIETLRNYLRAKQHGEPPPSVPAVPPTFSANDAQIASTFNDSPAGQAFTRFVQNGLPRLPKNEVMAAAVSKCRSSPAMH